MVVDTPYDFGTGNTNPETFPVEEFQQASVRAIEQMATTLSRYPGKLGNCTTCHADDTFTVPLQNSVLAPTFDTGPDIADPLDDHVVSPTAATCASCHDGATTRAHLQANGADFDTTQLEIDTGVVLEQCEICHGSGRAEDVSAVHPIN